MLRELYDKIQQEEGGGAHDRNDYEDDFDEEDDV